MYIYMYILIRTSQSRTKRLVCNKVPSKNKNLITILLVGGNFEMGFNDTLIKFFVIQVSLVSEAGFSLVYLLFVHLFVCLDVTAIINRLISMKY